MMQPKQQVNLFQPTVRTQRKLFTARSALQGLAAVMAGLLLVYAYAQWEVYGLRDRLDRLAIQRDFAQQRLESLEKTLPARVKSKQLEALVAQLDAELKQKRDVIDALSTDVLGYASGFSDYLEGLGRQRVDGLWLTGFQIANGGRNLRLTGSAVKPELVPALVQRLSEEDTFVGLKFRTLRVERSPENPRHVTFVLQTLNEEG